MTKVSFIEFSGNIHDVEATNGLNMMEIARNNGIPGILADCGGSMSCATCHVYVDNAWVDRVGEASELEQSMLECAVEPGPNSRLSCQIILNDQLDGVVIHIPESQL